MSKPGEIRGARDALAAGSALLAPAAALVTGNPLVGVVAAPIVAMFKEWTTRRLTALEDKRVAEVATVFVNEVKRRLEAGEVPAEKYRVGRGPTDLSELTEGMFHLASEMYESRKVRFLGRLTAELLFDHEGLSIHSDLRLIDEMRTLSYRQLELLAFLGGSGEEERVGWWTGDDLERQIAIRELDDLRRRGLVTGPGDAMHQLSPGLFHLTPPAKKLRSAAGLQELDGRGLTQMRRSLGEGGGDPR